MDVTGYSLTGAAGLYALKILGELAVPPFRKWRNGKSGSSEGSESSLPSALHRQIRHSSEATSIAHSQIAEALKYQTDVLKELIADIRDGRKATAAESLRTQEMLMELRIELAKAGK